MSAPRNVPTQTFIDGVTAVLSVARHEILGLLGLPEEQEQADAFVSNLPAKPPVYPPPMPAPIEPLAFLVHQPGGDWHEGLTFYQVPDLTRGRWPSSCDERTTFHEPYGSTDYTCTRRNGHTGRHAAGSDRYVRAVWR